MGEPAPNCTRTVAASAWARNVGLLLAVGATVAGCERWRTSHPRIDTSTSAALESHDLAMNGDVFATEAPADNSSRAVLPIAWQTSASPRPWRYLVLHHTATESGDVASIDAEHRRRKDRSGHPWRGIAYHFLIGNGKGMADGLIEPTFRWHEQLPGAHAGDEEHNAQGIGICLVGDFDRAPPSQRQQESTRALVDELVERFEIRREGILGHRDLKSTACPGRLFPLERIAHGPEGTARWSVPGIAPLADRRRRPAERFFAQGKTEP